MSRCSFWLWALALLLAFLHLGYFILERQQQPRGTHFSTGLVLLSDTELFTLSSRLHFERKHAYDFRRSVDWSQSYVGKIESYFRGSVQLTTANLLSKRLPGSAHSDDLAFNQMYSSKKEATLTLYRLPTAEETLCVYIKEVGKLHCLSAEKTKK